MEPNDAIIKLKVMNDAGDPEVLHVHQGVLRKSSGFFDSAMKSEWTELREESDIIELPNDSAKTVIDYIKWLYSGDVPIKLHEAADHTREKRAEAAEDVFVVLAEAYVFGEKVVDVKYKNAVVKAVVEARTAYNCHMGAKSVRIIYEGTPPGSSLRRFVAESIVYQAHHRAEYGAAWMQFPDELPKEVSVDALEAMVKTLFRPKRDYTCLAENFFEAE